MITRPASVIRRPRLCVQNVVATPPRRKPPTGGGGNNNNNGSSNNEDMFGDDHRMALNRLFYSRMTPGYLSLLVQKQFHRPTHTSIVTINGYYVLRIQPVDDYITEYEEDTAYDLICDKINHWGLCTYVTDKIKSAALTWFTTSVDIPLGIPVEGERVSEFLPLTANQKFEDLEEM